MFLRVGLFFLTVGMGMIGIAHGQDSTTTPSENPIHQQLRDVRDRVIAAVNAKDSTAILMHLHVNVVLTAQDGNRLNVVRGHAGVQDYLDRLLLGTNRGVESLKIDPKVDDLSILYHDNTAIAFGSSLDHYRLVGGQEFDLTTRWSATLVREGETWQIASLHVSTNLFDNPVLNATQQTIWWIAIGTAFLGLVVGWLVARAARKSS